MRTGGRCLHGTGLADTLYYMPVPYVAGTAIKALKLCHTRYS